MSSVNLFVIFLEPAVIVPIVAVAPEVPPVIVSPVTKDLPFVIINVIGVVVLIIIALQLLVAPVITSPLSKVPLILPVISNAGNLGSTLVLSESNTACNL